MQLLRGFLIAKREARHVSLHGFDGASECFEIGGDGDAHLFAGKPCQAQFLAARNSVHKTVNNAGNALELFKLELADEIKGDVLGGPILAQDAYDYFPHGSGQLVAFTSVPPVAVQLMAAKSPTDPFTGWVPSQYAVEMV